MAFQFEFDSANRILRLRFEGMVTDEELTTAYRLLAVHTERTPSRAGVGDFSGVTDFQVTTETLRRLAYSPPALANQDVPRFIVAPSQAIFGLARLFESHGAQTRPNIYVVRTREEVWAALSVQEPHFEPLPAQD
jgi:hypothetical protein